MNGIDAAMVGMVVSDTVEVRTSQAGKPWAAFNVGVGEGDYRQYVRPYFVDISVENTAAGPALRSRGASRQPLVWPTTNTFRAPWSRNFARGCL